MLDVNAIELGGAILAIVNCLVSVKVLLAAGITKTQKLLQIMIVWIVPALGALVVYLVHKGDDEPRGPTEPPFGGGAHDGMAGGAQ